MHSVDFFHRKDKTLGVFYSAANEDLTDCIKKSNVPEIRKQWFKNIYENKSKEISPLITEANNLNKEIREKSMKYDRGEISYVEYEIEYAKYEKKFKEKTKKIEEIKNNYYKYDLLSDIYDAISKGNLYSEGLPGHGSEYYSKQEFINKEIFAQYTTLSVFYNDMISELKKDNPKLVETLDNMILSLSRED